MRTGDHEDQRTSSLKGEEFSIPKGFQVDGRRSSVEDRSVHEYVRTEDHEDQRTSSLKGEGYIPPINKEANGKHEI